MLKLKKYYFEKFSETIDKEVQIQHWGRNRQLSMDGIALEYLPTTNNRRDNVPKA